MKDMNQKANAIFIKCAFGAIPYDAFSTSVRVST